MRISRLVILFLFGVVAITAAWTLTPSRYDGTDRSLGNAAKSGVPFAPTPPRAGLVPLGSRTPRYVGDDPDMVEDEGTRDAPLAKDQRTGPITAVIGPRNTSGDTVSRTSEFREESGNPTFRSNIFEDISRAGEGSGTRRGLGLRSGSSSIADGDVDGIDTEDIVGGTNQIRQRVGGQARGYSMLYMMNPRARSVVEAQVNVLLTSQINDLHIGVLVDGTFGQDYEYLRQVVKRLNTDGRTLLLTMYLVSGPTMRDFDRTPVRTMFSQIDPLRFRSLITSDRRIRGQFVRIAREARSVFELNKSLNAANRNVAVVMLEDNLDRSSYRAMRSLASGALGSVADFVRNPCLGCFTGNDIESFGDPLEEHTLEGFARLGEGDGYSLDGTSFSYPGEPPAPGPSADELRLLIDQANARGLAYFGLWRFNWQGIQPAQGLLSPDQRVYVPSTAAEQSFEISILRRGLQPVVPTPTPTTE